MTIGVILGVLFVLLFVGYLRYSVMSATSSAVFPTSNIFPSGPENFPPR